MKNKIATAAIANLLAETSGKNRKFCEDFIRVFFKLIADALEQGENVRIKAFGTFKLVDVDSRSGINVTTGERQKFAAHRKVVFTPAKEMASLINSPFELFESVEIDDDVPVPGDEEDKIDKSIIETGSIEESEDDEFTAEAYNYLETLLTKKDEAPPEKRHAEEFIAPPQEGEKQHKESMSYEYYQIEEAPQDTQENNSDDDYMNEYETTIFKKEAKNKYKYGFFAGAMTSLVICLIIFMLGCFFGWWPVNFSSPKEEIVTRNVTEVTSPRNSGIMDEEENPYEYTQPDASVPEISPKEEKTDKNTVYDTVTTTRYLTTIAREHYGNFNFWPYIYLENQSILGHPDRITPGTKIVIPPLSKFGVDPRNKNDIAKAKKLSQEIYAQYR